MDERQQMALRLAFLTWLADRSVQWKREVAEELGGHMSKGDKLTAWSPLNGDDALASISKSAPTADAIVTDQAALTAWLSEHYSEMVKQDWDITGPADEVQMVLLLHAPHLLTRRDRPHGWALAQIKKMCNDVGAVVGPGGETDIPGLMMTEPESKITVRDAKSRRTGQLIRELIEKRLISADGHLLEIEPGDGNP